MTTPTPPLPTFIIIGAQKSATRWLRSNLGKHPDIYTPPHEPSYFNSRNYALGLDFYSAQFPTWAGEPIVGEATPGYMMWRHKPPRVARRIHETIPDVRLIAVLRDPIERANSAMVHHIRRGRLRQRAKLTDVVRKKKPTDDKMCIVTGGWYASSLERYFELFGDQLLVVLHDDIARDPLWVYRSALEHIGASTDYVPEALSQVVFSNQSPEKTKRDTSVRPADRRKLWPYFAEEVDKLEPMIKRDLSAWDPTDDRLQWPDLPDDIVAYYQAAMDWIRSVVSGVTPEQYEDPTPCSEWNVAELLAHMGSIALLNAVSYSRPSDLAAFQATTAGDAVQTFLHLAEVSQQTLIDARRRYVAVAMPLGMLRADEAMMLSLKDQLAHAWDIAVATGQDGRIPDDLAGPIDAFTRQLFAVAPGARYAVEDAVDTGEDAAPGEQYLGRMGRDPRLSLELELDQR